VKRKDAELFEWLAEPTVSMTEDTQPHRRGKIKKTESSEDKHLKEYSEIVNILTDYKDKNNWKE